MISAQQNWDEILVNLNINHKKRGCVYNSNAEDKLKINQIKHTVNH